MQSFIIVLKFHNNACTMHPEPMLLLRGRLYGNNSIVNFNEIGHDNEALLCLTNSTDCCYSYNSANKLGHWYLPNSTIPVNASSIGFYRNRGPSVVRLHHGNDSIMLSGIFRCEIPDANRVNQTIYVGIYMQKDGMWMLYAHNMIALLSSINRCT